MTARTSESAAKKSGRWHAFHEKFIVEERLETREAKRNLYRWSVALIVVGLAGFVFTALSVFNQFGPWFIDEPLRAGLLEARTEGLTVPLNALSLFFGPGIFPFFSLIFTIGWVVFAKHLWRPFLLAIGTGLVIVSIRVIAESLDRPRPPVGGMMFGLDDSESFPSGHVGGAAAFILLVAYLVFSRRKAIRAAVITYVLAGILIILTTVSRLYLGYHWATDGLAAIFIALAVLGAIIALDTFRTVRVDPDVPADGSPAKR